MRSTPAPHKANFQSVIDFYTKALQRAGVECRFGKALCAADVLALAPDMTIVATGGKPVQPRFCQGAGALVAEDVLRGRETGQRVLVLGGGWSAVRQPSSSRLRART